MRSIIFGPKSMKSLSGASAGSNFNYFFPLGKMSFEKRSEVLEDIFTTFMILSDLSKSNELEIDFEI